VDVSSALPTGAHHLTRGDVPLACITEEDFVAALVGWASSLEMAPCAFGRYDFDRILVRMLPALSPFCVARLQHQLPTSPAWDDLHHTLAVHRRR
jgi:hypothetical protein